MRRLSTHAHSYACACLHPLDRLLVVCSPFVFRPIKRLNISKCPLRFRNNARSLPRYCKFTINNEGVLVKMAMKLRLCHVTHAGVQLTDKGLLVLLQGARQIEEFDISNVRYAVVLRFHSSQLANAWACRIFSFILHKSPHHSLSPCSAASATVRSRHDGFYVHVGQRLHTGTKKTQHVS